VARAEDGDRDVMMAVAVTSATRTFRGIGYADLRNQLIRCTTSTSANIVEGAGAASNLEFARFLGIAIRSANEAENHLLMARDLHLLPPAVWQSLTTELVEIRKMTFGYRKKVIARAAPNS
jgi:four helix bundle protein